MKTAVTPSAIPSTRPLPKRLAIIRALHALLEGISEENGDAFTMAGRVYRNRSMLGGEVTESPPAIGILEAPRADIGAFAGSENEMRKDLWTVLIQGICVDGRRGQSDDIYFLAQDAEKRLHRMMAEHSQTGRPIYPEHHMLGGMITSVEIAPPIVRPPENGVANNAFFYISIRLGVAMKAGD